MEIVELEYPTGIKGKCYTFNTKEGAVAFAENKGRERIYKVISPTQTLWKVPEEEGNGSGN